MNRTPFSPDSKAMKLEEIVCNNCGAPLEIPEGTNFVTCRHCNSRLAVKRTESASFTEVVSDLKDQVEKLTRQNEVEALDRQWEQERERFMVTGKHGHRHLPTRSGSVMGGVMITVFGVIWTAVAGGMATAASNFGGGMIGNIFMLFPLLGVAFVVSGIVTSIAGYNKAEEYEKAQREYERKRMEMSRELD